MRRQRVFDVPKLMACITTFTEPVPGDDVAVDISGIGILRNTIVGG